MQKSPCYWTKVALSSFPIFSDFNCMKKMVIRWQRFQSALVGCKLVNSECDIFLILGAGITYRVKTFPPFTQLGRPMSSTATNCGYIFNCKINMINAKYSSIFAIKHRHAHFQYNEHNYIYILLYYEHSEF